MLANVLVAKGFERSWLAKPRLVEIFGLKDDPESFHNRYDKKYQKLYQLSDRFPAQNRGGR